MTKWVLSTIFAGGLFLSPSIQAQTWSTIGTSCSPGVDSIGLYTYSNATFEFEAGETGTIRTRCQINNPLDSGVPSWKTLSFGYVDPDGNRTDYEVQAQLTRVNRSTGVTAAIATIDSNSFGSSGPVWEHVPISHTFNFTSYSYYMTLTVSRADTNGNPGIWYASLQ